MDIKLYRKYDRNISSVNLASYHETLPKITNSVKNVLSNTQNEFY